MSREFEHLSEIVAQIEESDSRQWLTTYADMVTLLLTFFVMLLAISNVDSERFENVMQSIQFTLGASVAPGGQTGRIDVHSTKRKSLSPAGGAENEPLLKDMQQRIKEKNIDDMVEVSSQFGKIIIRVKGQVLFESAQAALKPSSNEVLTQIARIVRDYPGYRLHVSGHTDDLPIKTAKFDNNWDLSALRATSVLRYLLKQGVSASRLTATGYAHTDPLAPNTSAENRARNRRVEFVLEKEN